MDWDIQSDEFISEMEDIIFGDKLPELICGCIVESDGICPCGNKSPLLEMGMI